jgi:predicted ATPase/class 3 adenylate cyclase
MANLPTGTVTFLFTDIEGSTHLWEKYPESMPVLLAKHDAILKQAIESNHGQIIKTTGDGAHAVFEKAIDAVNATLAAQHALRTPEMTLRVRMGFHTGEAELREGDYYGQTLNRTARIMSVAHGGQILLSGITSEIVRDHLPANISLFDLGEHRLKDLARTERLFQLSAPDLTRDFPPLNSLDALPNNLPIQLSSFIGRESQMSEAGILLSTTRLLTFIGPGGTGKTRLSLQLAAERLTDFKDGVWLIELAPLTDPVLIIFAIASVFNIREVQGVSLSDLVVDYLRARQPLLILDNCEHLVEACAQAAEQLLHLCPQLKIIASSREALGIPGEVVFRVPSLNLPEKSLSEAALMECEATRLFIERATKAEPRFQLSEHNAASIIQICRRLDGIPLAIELAAARVKIFTPEQIAERLDDRFKLLTGGSRTALPRQQTLRALIDWSYQSLNETEQRALRQLAAFSGGWTFEGAESVVGEADAMDSLLGLVNKSLVNVEEQDDESRYRFLETIRQYAMEKLLESGEAIETRNRHFEYVLHIAGVAEEKMFGAESSEWLDQMEVEHDNLRAAFEWSTANYPAKGLRLAQALGGFWTSRDYNSEARAVCSALLKQTETLPDLDRERGSVYALLGWNSITVGDHKTGRAAAEASLALAIKVNDRKTHARACSVLALSSIFLGDFPTAQAAVLEGETIARQDGLMGELGLILSIRAQTTYFGEGDIVKTKAYLEESDSLGRDAGYRWTTSMSAFGLARVAAAIGDLETARTKFLESAEIANEFGNKRIVYSSQSELAHVLREHGEINEPLNIYRELLPKWKDLGHRAAVAHELECIGFIFSKKGNTQRAAQLLGAAEVLRAAIDSSMTPMERAEYEQEISALHSRMNDVDFEKAWNEGRAMTMDGAIENARKA